MHTINGRPSIVDIEASGFGADSYPIEIGVARDDGALFCRLIKPYPEWTHWDKHAQTLHGISRQHLSAYGENPRTVCQQLNQFLGNRTAYSDGWVVDKPWLTKLYAAANVSMTFQLSALEYLLSEAQMQRWHEVKRAMLDQDQDCRHRASADAQLIQSTFMKTAEKAAAHTDESGK